MKNMDKINAYGKSIALKGSLLGISLATGLLGCVGASGFNRGEFRDSIDYSGLSRIEKRDANDFWDMLKDQDDATKKIYSGVYRRNPSFDPLNPSNQDKDLICEEAEAESITAHIFCGH